MQLKQNTSYTEPWKIFVQPIICNYAHETILTNDNNPYHGYCHVTNNSLKALSWSSPLSPLLNNANWILYFADTIPFISWNFRYLNGIWCYTSSIISKNVKLCNCTENLLDKSMFSNRNVNSCRQITSALAIWNW